MGTAAHTISREVVMTTTMATMAVTTTMAVTVLHCRRQTRWTRSPQREKSELRSRKIQPECMMSRTRRPRLRSLKIQRRQSTDMHNNVFFSPIQFIFYVNITTVVCTVHVIDRERC